MKLTDLKPGKLYRFSKAVVGFKSDDVACTDRNNATYIEKGTPVMFVGVEQLAAMKVKITLLHSALSFSWFDTVWLEENIQEYEGQ